MSSPNAAAAGHFTIGGDLQVNRLGFGAMRVTGRGIWGPPAEKAEAISVLKRLPELGINFIDTADSYGPHVSEELIREALNPYPQGLVIATKAGFQRGGPFHWTVDGRPEKLREGLEGSLKRLGVDRIDLWQLHRIDSRVPRKEQFDAIREFRQQELIRHVGLSEVSVEDIRDAQHYFQVVTVQNRYNVTDRASASVLRYCENHTIGFIPWAPLGGERATLAKAGGVIADIARAHKATSAQIAIAWSLRRSPVILAIPGTGHVAHLEENTAAAGLQLTDAEFEALEAVGA
jgi:pyridoxine 4-dehydrogenase